MLKKCILVIAILSITALVLVGCSGKKETSSSSVVVSEGNSEIQLSQANDNSVSDTSLLEKAGEVWVDDDFASQGFLFENGTMYQVEKIGDNTWRIVNKVGTYTENSISFGATNAALTSTVNGNSLVLSGMFSNYECTRATGQKIDYEFMR